MLLKARVSFLLHYLGWAFNLNSTSFDLFKTRALTLHYLIAMRASANREKQNNAGKEKAGRTPSQIKSNEKLLVL